MWNPKIDLLLTKLNNNEKHISEVVKTVREESITNGVEQTVIQNGVS